MVVIFLTRPGCHLCEDALPMVSAEVTRAGGTLELVNVEEDDTLEAEYGHRIPVVLSERGEVLAEGLIAPRRLRRRLRRSG